LVRIFGRHFDFAQCPFFLFKSKIPNQQSAIKKADQMIGFLVAPPGLPARLNDVSRSGGPARMSEFIRSGGELVSKV